MTNAIKYSVFESNPYNHYWYSDHKTYAKARSVAKVLNKQFKKGNTYFFVSKAK